MTGKTRFTGSIPGASDRDLGGVVILVVEATVRKVGREETATGPVDVVSLHVEDALEVPRDRGRALLNGLRQAGRLDGSTLPGVVEHEVAAGERIIAEAEDVVRQAAGAPGPDDELEITDDDAELDDEADERPVPDDGDRAFVGRAAVHVRADLIGLTDYDRLLRLLAAEHAGRNRKGVIEVLERRAREVYLATGVDAPNLPDDAFDVPADVIADPEL
jgi:hypothetical protein